MTDVAEAVAERLDLRFTQGDDFVLTLTFADNVAASTFSAKVRPTKSSSTSWSFAVDMAAAASGVVVISLSDTQTAAMPVSAVWDCQETLAGITLTFLEGKVRVDRDVTH